MTELDFSKIGLEIQRITRNWFDVMSPGEPTIRWKSNIPIWAQSFGVSGLRFTPAHEKLNEIEGSPFSIGILIEHEAEYETNIDDRIQSLDSDLKDLIPEFWVHSKGLQDIETGPDGPYTFQYHSFAVVFSTERLFNSHQIM